MRTVIAIAAGMLGAAFLSAGTAPASAAPPPCTGGANVQNSQACADCFIAAGMSAAADSACIGVAVVKPGSTGFADCDAMQDAIHRSNCLDAHILAGQLPNSSR
jgi:hypothetical protein